jgi:hypothetical protein
MKDQLIIILEAMRLSRAALEKHRLSDGPNADSTIRELQRFLEDQSVAWAMEVLYPELESPSVAPNSEIGSLHRHQVSKLSQTITPLSRSVACFC